MCSRLRLFAFFIVTPPHDNCSVAQYTVCYLYDSVKFFCRASCCNGIVLDTAIETVKKSRVEVVAKHNF